MLPSRKWELLNRAKLIIEIVAPLVLVALGFAQLYHH
jgi:hypothetical protein